MKKKHFPFLKPRFLIPALLLGALLLFIALSVRPSSSFSSGLAPYAAYLKAHQIDINDVASYTVSRNEGKIVLQLTLRDTGRTPRVFSLSYKIDEP